jgi:coenzyme Q-binding protein COQ10
MPSFTTEHRVGHSAADMFALVADVEQYPKFVPLCERLVVRRRGAQGGKEILIAEMTIGYKLIRETVTTRVVLDRKALNIAVSYLEGPFHHLDSDWLFTPEGERACRVRFAIDYDFKSRLLAGLMGSVFDAAFRKFATAFEARADQVYGRGAATPPAFPVKAGTQGKSRNGHGSG